MTFSTTPRAFLLYYWDRTATRDIAFSCGQARPAVDAKWALELTIVIPPHNPYTKCIYLRLSISATFQEMRWERILTSLIDLLSRDVIPCRLGYIVIPIGDCVPGVIKDQAVVVARGY